MNSILVFLLLSFSAFSLNEKPVDHAIYISVTEIELLENQPSKVSIKIFTDDLKAAIQNFSGNARVVSDEEYVNINKEVIAAYINKHLILSSNDQNLKFKYQSHTLEGDAYFLNFDFNLKSGSSSLSIKAEYLMELFPTQQNVVKINFDGDNRFLKFDSSTETQTVNFN